MLEIKTDWLDSRSLQLMLNRSNIEFEILEVDRQQSIFAKYSTELKGKNLLGIELYDGDNLVASAMSVYKNFYSKCGPIKLSFLTQVIVQEHFRGQGKLKILIDAVQDADMNNSSLASVVIARRQVRDLYSKFGYRGFGIFPQVIVNNTHTSPKFISNIPKDLKIMAQAYENTYKAIAGSLYRSDEYWQYLQLEIRKSCISFDSVRNGNDFGYIIFSKRECIEIASTNPALFSSLIEKSLILGINKFKIASNHPAFQSVMSFGGNYVIRPELTEGHMLKAYKKGDPIDKYLSEIQEKLERESFSPKFSIDINLLNEW